MIGKIFITASGYDPENGKHVKDPYLGDMPSLGACRPDVRKTVQPGDYIFIVSGKVPGVSQTVIGGFEVAELLSTIEAYHRFPSQRLHIREDGQISGNIVIAENGLQHPLDQHAAGRKFERRIAAPYVVGANPIALITPSELKRGREQTVEMLARIIGKLGRQPHDLFGRSAKKLNERQVRMMLEWLQSLKDDCDMNASDRSGSAEDQSRRLLRRRRDLAS